MANEFILKRIRCFTTEDETGADNLNLYVEINNNNERVDHLTRNLNDNEIWEINKAYEFNDKVTIKLYDKDELLWFWDNADPDDELINESFQATTKSIEDYSAYFHGGGKPDGQSFSYELVFSMIIEGGIPAVNIQEISFRSFFSRMGQGIIDKNLHSKYVTDNLIYLIGNEVISLRDIFNKHELQDRGKINNGSIRNWVQTHCNFWSPDTIISELPIRGTWRDITIVAGGTNWADIIDEGSYEIAGFQLNTSYKTWYDNPMSHKSLDWCFDVILDPQYMYMHGNGFPRKREGNLDEIVPYMHNELETASFPFQWRPFFGEYITAVGRFIWDLGHDPVKSEIHPAHTIIKEHATAADLMGDGNIVAVNEVIIGIGISGGFPDWVETRWQKEFPGFDITTDNDIDECWVTNFKKHPLNFKIFPPVTQPDDGSSLNVKISICEYRSVHHIDGLEWFLNLAQQDNPGAFYPYPGMRNWDSFGSEPQLIPAMDAKGTTIEPKFTLKNGPNGKPAYYEVSIDFNGLPESEIPVAYYAIVHCGWSKKGIEQLKEYKLTFKSLYINEESEPAAYDEDDIIIPTIQNDGVWQLHYGVNGEWHAYWPDWGPLDFPEGETIVFNKVFAFWTVGAMPIIIKDVGIDWEGRDFMGNSELDSIELVLKGPNHFESLKRLVASSDGNLVIKTETETEIEFSITGVRGMETEQPDDKHTWHLKLELIQTLNDN